MEAGNQNNLEQRIIDTTVNVVYCSNGLLRHSGEWILRSTEVLRNAVAGLYHSGDSPAEVAERT